jgi:hypothetical protein
MPWCELEKKQDVRVEDRGSAIAAHLESAPMWCKTATSRTSLGLEAERGKAEGSTLERDPHIGFSEETPMLNRTILDDVSARVAAAFAASPARDAEKNLKAMLTSALAKLDLVTREEFDIQAGVLLRTREKLEALEERVTALEARAGSPR